MIVLISVCILTTNLQSATTGSSTRPSTAKRRNSYWKESWRLWSNSRSPSFSAASSSPFLPRWGTFRPRTFRPCHQRWWTFHPSHRLLLHHHPFFCEGEEPFILAIKGAEPSILVIKCDKPFILFCCVIIRFSAKVRNLSFFFLLPLYSGSDVWEGIWN